MRFSPVVRGLAIGSAVVLLAQLSVSGVTRAFATELPADPAAVSPTAAPAAVAPEDGITGGATAGPTIFPQNYELTADETWGPQGSPYVLSGRTTIMPGVSLTLLPGTVVKVDGQTSELLVWARLVVCWLAGLLVVRLMAC